MPANIYFFVSKGRLSLFFLYCLCPSLVRDVAFSYKEDIKNSLNENLHENSYFCCLSMHPM